jgi:hypothetical protein
MASFDQGNLSHPAARPGQRPRATDPVQDALVRREEEFRRFLVSVVSPAFDELRSSFRADGKETRAEVTTRPGRPAEATITVGTQGQIEFFYTIRAAISPQQATVLKRRPVPDRASNSVAVEETLLGHSEDRSNATLLTRAEVVASVRTDYWVLHR